MNNENKITFGGYRYMGHWDKLLAQYIIRAGSRADIFGLNFPPCVSIPYYILYCDSRPHHLSVDG